jgi:hypothetical protein
MKGMPAVENLKTPAIHSHEEIPKNCSHELIKEATHVNMVLLFDLREMTAPTQR